MDPLLRDAARALAAFRTKRGHLRDCRVGNWVDGHSYPDGAPCSARCAEVARVLLAVDQRAAAEAREAARQGELFEEAE